MVEINVPNKLEELTVDQYQAFSRVTDETDNGVFVAQKMVSIFCKIRLSEVARIKYTSVAEIVQIFERMFEEKTPLVRTFKMNNVEFGFIPDLENMSMGEYADLDQYIDDSENLHKAMAVLYRPITKRKGEKYEIEEYNGSITYSDVMKYAPLNVALGAKVFFWTLERELLKATLNYLEEETVTNIQQSHNLAKNGDGTLASMHLVKVMLDDLRQSVDSHSPSALRGYFSRVKGLKQKEEI